MHLVLNPIRVFSISSVLKIRSKIMSCCPPNAEKYLAATYATSGTTQTLANGHEFYVTGPIDSKKAVILIPDVYGWNGGRTRNVADWLGEAGYYTIVPKLLIPALEGGTDGDGLPPTFDFATDGAKFGPYMHLASGWEENLKPRIVSVTDHINGLGINKIHLIGNCWGGWVGAHVLSSDLADKFLSLAIPHPSISLENMVWGRSVQELIDRVQKPMLFMPAKGDPDEYREGGAWYASIKSRFPTSQVVDFVGENHGFLPRGDISNLVTKEAVELCLETIHAFFKKHEEAV